MSKKGKIKSKNFTEFAIVFKSIYAKDKNFSNCVDLLYSKVQRRKSLKNENKTIWRYNKIFDQLEDLDWLFDEKHSYVPITR